MIKREYYGLISGLGKLLPGKSLSESILSYLDLLSVQLDPKDYYQAVMLMYTYDNQNFLSTYFERGTFNSNGNLKEDELSLIIKNRNSEDVYFNDFLENYSLSDESLSQIQIEKYLTQHYYDFIQNNGNAFLANWAQFNLTLRNLTTVYSLRALGIDDDDQFINGGYFSGIELKRINIADLDRQYPYLKRKFEALEIKNPIDRKLKVDEIKWEYLDDQSFFEYFTVERALTHLLKLMDLEVWKTIDNELGNELIEQYVERVNVELETLIK